jgi:hypothetical protein
MFLIDDLLLSPITGFKFILRTLERVAEEQYTDDAPLKERLLELQEKLDSGEVSEEEYVQQEADILRGLRDLENRKREMAGLPPEERSQPFSGKVGEGSGVTVNLEHVRPK